MTDEDWDIYIASLNAPEACGACSCWFDNKCRCLGRCDKKPNEVKDANEVKE